MITAAAASAIAIAIAIAIAVEKHDAIIAATVGPIDLSHIHLFEDRFCQASTKKSCEHHDG